MIAKQRLAANYSARTATYWTFTKIAGFFMQYVVSLQV